MRKLAKRLSYANAMSTLAVFLVLEANGATARSRAQSPANPGAFAKVASNGVVDAALTKGSPR